MSEPNNNNKVWIVTASMLVPYMIESDTHVVGVFSTKEQAEEAERYCQDWMKTLPNEHHRIMKAVFSTDLSCFEMDVKYKPSFAGVHDDNTSTQWRTP